jgi:dTDP-4-dehydrorhamnose reductase
MRLLVAGWQGQLAKAIVEAALPARDIEACSLGRPALDLCHVPSVQRAMADNAPDVVINTAAYTAVDQAEQNEAAAHALNCEGARQLALAAAARGVPIVHMSTAYVFDGRKAGPYVEGDAPSPACAYGRTKLAGELAVAAANPRHIILRTTWVVSPWGRNFVRNLLEQAARDSAREIEVVDDRYGSPTYAPHLAAAILDIARRVTAKSLCSGHGSAPWGTYHAAGSGSASWCEVARETFTRSSARGGPASVVRPVATSPADAALPSRRHANASLDCSRLAADLGVRLPDWRSGVAECVERLASP